MNKAPTLLLSRRDLASLMRPPEYLRAAEAAFRAVGEGRAHTAAPMHIEASEGVFHAKGGALQDERAYVVLKFNANFPGNPARAGLPTIQGAILLCDAENGALLCILDSVEITLRRTAAASALAARLLAPKEARRLLLCGCGVQGQAHAEAMAGLFSFEEAFCWDADPAKAVALAKVLSEFAPRASAVRDLSVADRCEIIVTTTTSTSPFLRPEHVAPRAFIAAVGADNPNKSELTPDLVARAALICDSAAQCASMGDLHHALAAGAISLDDVRCELSDVLLGGRARFVRKEEIVIFDSTGLAVQDAAAAAMAYERAREAGVGISWTPNDA